MISNDDTAFPKYGCRQCGSVKLRGNFDTFQVFRAEGEVIVHLGSEYLVSGLLGLFCYECDGEIAAESLGDIKIR